jgi:Fe2+ or Zn2+ uptake regulation protein
MQLIQTVYNTLKVWAQQDLLSKVDLVGCYVKVGALFTIHILYQN